MFTDQPVVCISDELLRQVYDSDWKMWKERLERGDLTALKRCPFARPLQNTPLFDLNQKAAEDAGMLLQYLPIIGDINTMMQLCIDGKAALITFRGSALRTRGMPAWYPLSSFPAPLPAGYICYRTNEVLSPPARRFLDLSRRFLRRYGAE